MRILLIILLAIPFCSRAQVNKSAVKLAHENIEEYLKSKLFRNKLFTSVSYGQLKERKEKDNETVWEMDHVFFVLDETQPQEKSSNSAKQEYYFTFYFDRKMNVTRAESSQ
ncbi:MAG: hypothetical protein ACJ75F_06735 [Flavisolibacter sp.]